MTSVEPVLKWVGGKRSSLKHILKMFPDNLNGKYYEPFLGGGAVAFSLGFEQQVLSDANEELISFYRVVRDHPQELISKLRQFEVSRDFYYQIRSWDRDADFAQASAVEKAARTYFLNKCGYNGLYRVNSRGQFNVPFGNKTELPVNESKIVALSAKLRGESGLNIVLSSHDFESAVEGASAGDLVYFDPPYVPLSSTANFVSYGQDGFTDFDHERLAKVIGSLSSRGVLVIMSNSNADKSYRLFSEFGEMSLVPVQRLLSAKVASRSLIHETLFTNADRIGYLIS